MPPRLRSNRAAVAFATTLARLVPAGTRSGPRRPPRRRRDRARPSVGRRRMSHRQGGQGEPGGELGRIDSGRLEVRVPDAADAVHREHGVTMKTSTRLIVMSVVLLLWCAAPAVAAATWSPAVRVPL